MDIKTYRLKVNGLVKNPLSLAFDEVKQMPAVTNNMILDCPGFFTDKGDWTGVPVKTILERAGVTGQNAKITFVALDESYKQSFSLERAMSDDLIIAYQFNGKEFPEIHGFPLRLAAKGMAGSNWVKWLGEIRVEKQ